MQSPVENSGKKQNDMNVSPSFIITSGITVLLLAVVCSLPTEVEPVTWQMHLEVPVIDRQYSISELISASGLAGDYLVSGNTGVADDTLSVIREDSLYCSFSRRLGNNDTTTIHTTLGAFTLHNTPYLDYRFSLSSGQPHSNNAKKIHTPSSTLHLTEKRKVEGIQSITVDETSPPCTIRVENSCRQTDFQSLTISLITSRDTVMSFGTSCIPAQTNALFPVSLAGKTIKHEVTIAVSVTLRQNAVINCNDGIRIVLSLDGQTVSEAVITDSLINYENMYPGSIRLTDSLRIDAIDLESTIVDCDVFCPSLLKMEITSIITNSLDRDFCILHDIESLDQLPPRNDHQVHSVKTTTDTLFNGYNKGHNALALPISSMRIFPVWDQYAGQSQIQYQFKFRSISEGRLIHFRKNDVFILRVFPPQLPFSRIHGSFVKETEMKFSAKAKVGFDWNTSFSDRLKQSIHIQSAQLACDLYSDLPADSHIDSMKIHIGLTNNNRERSSSVFDKTLTDIYSDAHHTATIDLADLLNSWPDSILFDSRFSLPAGTEITLFAPDFQQYDYRSSLLFAMALNWRLTIPLCWKITDAIQIELDTTSFALPSDQLGWISTLRQPKLQIHITIENHTNIGATLHAIGTDGRHLDELLAFPDSLIGTDEMKQYPGENLFTLFDSNGLRMEQRGDKSTSVLELDKNGIDALISEERCIIRWFLVIPTREIDALHATDFCSIKATGLIDGIASTDSLLNDNHQDGEVFQQVNGP